MQRTQQFVFLWSAVMLRVADLFADCILPLIGHMFILYSNSIFFQLKLCILSGTSCISSQTDLCTYQVYIYPTDKFQSDV